MASIDDVNATLEAISGNVTVVSVASALLAKITTFDDDDIVVVEQSNADNIWLLICAFLVFFMHAGFTMLEAGSVRMKNSMNIMFKNVGTIAIGSVLYFLFGFGFAYGADNKEYEDLTTSAQFIGTGGFANNGLSNSAKAGMVFQLMFAATAATIVSGTVAGRVSLPGYFIVASVLTMWVYPVVSHWIWSNGGWLSAFTNPTETVFGSEDDPACGMVDFAGSGVVHMTGGVAGFWGALIIGPRIGRFADDGTPNDLSPHNYALVTLGTFILWFGWYGFNCGSTLVFEGENTGKIAVTTTLAPSAAGITGIFVKYFLTKKWDLATALNCLLAGLVSITASCSVVADASAIPIGIIGALVYIAAEKLMVKLKIDDPVNAVAVHGFCGMWGVLTVAFFGTEDQHDAAGYAAECQGVGAFGTTLKMQITGILAIIAWVSAHMIPLFLVLKVTGVLRVPEEIERAGIDVSEHGGQAYETMGGNMTGSGPTSAVDPIKMDE